MIGLGEQNCKVRFLGFIGNFLLYQEYVAILQTVLDSKIKDFKFNNSKVEISLCLDFHMYK